MPVRGRRVRAVGLVAAGCLAAALLTPGSVDAAGAPDVVGGVPATTTPDIHDDGADPTIKALATVGSSVVIGGRFTQISDAGSSVVKDAQNLAVYDAATGVVTALPQVNGTVTTVLPGSTPGTVYVGGSFTTVDSTKVSNLALLDVSSGTVVRSFKTPAFDNTVTDLERVGNHLLVSGKFRKVGGKTRTALVSLSTTKGTDDGWVSLSVNGHHNWTGTNPAENKGVVGILKMALTPGATRLVVIGNFTTISGLDRDQIALITLTGTHPKVLTTWATTALRARCNYKKWDSWVRDVAVSPDGTYAVVANTGGPNAGTPCDGALRLELATRSADVQPTWIASTGGDTLAAVAVAPKVVYVGGHQRWLNNYHGSNSAQDGAVPRPSLAALDPSTGVPYSWNPGQNPRGVGVAALLLTPDGLLVGSDNDYIGNRAYLRQRLALFPLATGTTLPDLAPPSAPDLYRAGAPGQGAGDVQRLHLGTSGVDYVWPAALTSTVDWDGVRGAFTAGGSLWLATAAGSLARQDFDGTQVVAGNVVEPWADPSWRDVSTGSGQTYAGQPSTLATQLPQVRALTYANGRLYYALTGSTALHVRWFNAESGIVADREATVRGVTIPATVTGLFVQGSSMYLAAADGSLTRRTLLGPSLAAAGTIVSGPAVDGVDWGDAVLWSGPGPAVP